MPVQGTGILGPQEYSSTGRIVGWGAAMTATPGATVTAPSAQLLSPMTTLQGLGIPAFCTAVTLAAQTSALSSMTFWYVPSSGTYLVSTNIALTSVTVTGNTILPALTYWANTGGGPGVGTAVTVFGSATQCTTLGIGNAAMFMINAAASSSAGGTTDSALQISVIQAAGGTPPGYTLNVAVLRLS